MAKCTVDNIQTMINEELVNHLLQGGMLKNRAKQSVLHPRWVNQEVIGEVAKSMLENNKLVTVGSEVYDRASTLVTKLQKVEPKVEVEEEKGSTTEPKPEKKRSDRHAGKILTKDRYKNELTRIAHEIHDGFNSKVMDAGTGLLVIASNVMPLGYRNKDAIRVFDYTVVQDEIDKINDIFGISDDERVDMTVELLNTGIAKIHEAVAGSAKFDTAVNEHTLEFIQDENGDAIEWDALKRKIKTIGSQLEKEISNGWIVEHELMHSITNDWMDANPTDPRVIKINELYKQAKKYAKANPESKVNTMHIVSETNAAYWKKDIKEFVSEMVSRPELADEFDKVMVDMGDKKAKSITSILGKLVKEIIEHVIGRKLTKGSITHESIQAIGAIGGQAWLDKNSKDKIQKQLEEEC